MVPLAKGALGLLALGAAAGAGFGASYLHSESKRGTNTEDANTPQAQIEKKSVALPDVRKWLNTSDDTDKAHWEKKVSDYKSSANPRLDGYSPEEGNEKKDSNVSKMKVACKSLKEDKFEASALAGKLKQAEDWCSIKKKVEEMFDKNKYVKLSFVESETGDSKEWDEMFKKELKEKKFNVTGWKSTSESDSNKASDIKLMKGKCKSLVEGDVDDNKANVTLFETWCTKPKNASA